MNASADRHRYAIDFAIAGDIRFIAHGDMVRLFTRAAARSELPVVFTQGFNPRMRVALPFPRPVGQGSDVERVLLDLREQVPPEEASARLQPQVPDGFKLTRAKLLSPNDSSPACWVRYRIHVADADCESLAPRISALLASDTVEITRIRHKDKKSRVVNIRPFIDTIHTARCELTVSMWNMDSGSATPVEVCRALGMEADTINHRVRRVEIKWRESQKSPMLPP